MKFGSMCSGIEAASVAFEPLGWVAAWFAEIEPFPSAVLAHHYPSVPNLGDMTKVAGQVLDGSVEAPDVLCGGTPCQAFSVAGLRNSMADERGGLTLKFVEAADAIDYVRTRRGEDECIVLWENVPGVLSTKDNAFGCFLAALVGESVALEPTGGRWTDAGCVYGPKRAAAWRVLDAQYFGLAQRRRRVFVVASARRWFDPAEVLFERDGMRRDSAPRRGSGQDVAGRAPFGPALQCGCGYIFGTGLGAYGCPNCEGDDGPAVSVLAGVPAFGAGNQHDSVFQAPTLTATGGRLDFDSEVFAATPAYSGASDDDVAHTLRGEGFDASEDGTGRGTPLFTVAGTLQASGKAAGSATQQDAEAGLLVPVHCREIAQTITSNYGKQVDSSDTALGPNVIAFDCKASGMAGFGVGDIASTMRAMGCAGSHSNGGGQLAVAHVQIMPTMTAGGPSDTSHNQVSGQMRDAYMVPTKAMQVRRLTPVECERLQGFPDNYTAIPWRKKPASECPDGPRYKALGNSWAVFNVRWIGRRINAQISARTEAV